MAEFLKGFVTKTVNDAKEESIVRMVGDQAEQFGGVPARAIAEGIVEKVMNDEKKDEKEDEKKDDGDNEGGGGVANLAEGAKNLLGGLF